MPAKKVRSIKQELKKNEFRVTVFGSARIKKNDEQYKQVYDFAKEIGTREWDIITGGGPGLMEAANRGHAEGDKASKADSIGLVIKLPFEAKDNPYLEISKKFDRFSGRLDHFMALSSAFVLMPGGLGTTLELFYAWQLIQVKHMSPIPIILVGNMWKQLIKWVKNYPIKNGLASPRDLDYIYVVKNHKQALEILEHQYAKFKKNGKNGKNIKKYKIS